MKISLALIALASANVAYVPDNLPVEIGISDEIFDYR